MSDYAGLDIKDLREALLNADVDALADSGLLSDRVAQKLLLMEESYTPESGLHFETGEPAYYASNTQRYRRIKRKNLTSNLGSAIRNGNWEVIAFALGRGNIEEQVRMDFVDYQQLISLIQEPAFMLFFFAAPRTGKTFSAVRVVDLWLMLFPQGKVASNIRSWAEKHPKAEYVDDLPSLVEWADDPGVRKLFVGDEFSSEAAAADLADPDLNRAVRRFTRKMGKDPYQLSLIGIGHRPTDIAPVLRSDELSYFAFKEGKSKKAARKKMTVYEGLKGDEPVDEYCSLSGIGLPAVEPDTNDKASWGWGTPEKLAELGLVDLDDEKESEEDDVVQCRAVTRAGKQCPHDAVQTAPAVCKAHRGWDDLVDEGGG